MIITPLLTSHEAALREFLDAFSAAGEGRIPAFFLGPDVGIDDAVRALNRWEEGLGVPEGFVPSTTRFLESESRLLGVFNLRQRLTPALQSYGGHIGYSVSPASRGHGHAKRLLRAALKEAREYEINPALLTCSPENLASRAVIESCGGEYQDTHFDERTAAHVCRFWVPNP